MPPEAARPLKNDSHASVPCSLCIDGLVDCRSCRGDGLYRTYDGDEIPCPSCFAEGLVVCSACRGTGFRALIARHPIEAPNSVVGQGGAEAARPPDRHVERSFWDGHRFQPLMAAYITAIALMALISTFL